jgi:hypothetical protein
VVIVSAANPFEVPYSAAVTAALHGGTPAPIPVVRTVICDCCGENLTDDVRPGGFTFDGFGGTWASGPCCAAREEPRLRRSGTPVAQRCPERVPFADWVRAMRGPDAAITVTRRGAL